MMTSGKRVRNTLVIYPKVRNNSRKLELIPNVLYTFMVSSKAPALWAEPMAYQLVGGVKDHQGYDR